MSEVLESSTTPEQLEDPSAEQLKLGVSLRRRARREQGSRRLETLRKAIEAWEAALYTYCNCLPQPTDIEPQYSTDAAPAQSHKKSADVDPADLLLEATSGPFVGNVYELEEIVELLWESCSSEIRNKDVRVWALNMITLGCALTLIGKCESASGDAARLQDAIDTFTAVLNEPRLSEVARERALAHTNMAEVLCSMGEMAFGAEQVGYFESAVDALGKALSIVAPEGLRYLVEDEAAGVG